MPGAFDGGGHGALVFGTSAGTATRVNLGHIGNITPQFLRALVIDDFIFVSAEETNLALGHIPCPVGSHSRARPGSGAGCCCSFSSRHCL